jgi:hypothetical protein
MELREIGCEEGRWMQDSVWWLRFGISMFEYITRINLYGKI